MEEYLEHHGIKGQKWGIRRFQNTNGSLTDAGKKRYTLSEKKEIRRERKQQIETAVKQKIINDRLSMAKNDQLYWEHQRDITEKYLKELESGKWDKDYSSKEEVREAIAEEKENVKRYSAYAKDWIDSQKELMNMDISSIGIKDLKKATSRSALINRQIDHYDRDRQEDVFD